MAPGRTHTARNWWSAGDLGRLSESPEQLGRQETRELNKLVRALRGPGECEMETDKQVFLPVNFPKRPSSLIICGRQLQGLPQAGG